MGKDMSILMDLISIGGGLFLLISPQRAYNFGRRGQAEEKIPAKWVVISRIFGCASLAFGLFMIYLDFFAA